MNSEINNIINTWVSVGRPESGVTGIEFYYDDISNLLKTLSFVDVIDVIEEWEIRYPLTNLNIDYATYLMGAYVVYGYRNWFGDDYGDEISDCLLIDFSAYCGRRFSAEEILASAGSERAWHFVLFLGRLLFEKKLLIRRDREDMMASCFWRMNELLLNN